MNTEKDHRAGVQGTKLGKGTRCAGGAEDGRAPFLTFDGVLQQRVQQGSRGAVVQPQPAKQDGGDTRQPRHLGQQTPAPPLPRKAQVTHRRSY